ncbi:hypothetical protein WJX81_006871 [Elliptochloris bilobata]|uniref:ABC1 atypical kinase-like domain-containing protein n=1 Tax=Elliptochloris bilobata TaxID=381761 RepID=A0AAW1SCH0_9CHLO
MVVLIDMHPKPEPGRREDVLRPDLCASNSALQQVTSALAERALGDLREEVAQHSGGLGRVEELEQQLVAVTSSLNTLPTGQRLVAVGVPLAAASLYSSTESAQCHAAEPGRGLPLVDVRAHAHQLLFGRFLLAAAEEVLTLLRGVYLYLLFMPAVLSAPVCMGLGVGRKAWLLLMRWTLERAGPAFIKWGQWAATRPDLFPGDLCTELARLHTGAPGHTLTHTRTAVEAAFRRPLEELFDEFDPAPVASGSIAQVHRAVLSARGASGSCYQPGTVVAVKVRHPGVSPLMQRDVLLMHRAAALSARLPGLAALRLDESVRQFGGPLREQLDLALEARHLARFNRNFRSWRNLSFPSPIFPLVAPDVLVETFEQGRLISTYVNSPNNRYNKAVADLGLNCYLKMLLKDNFIHADLHPGNILVRVVDPNSPWGRVAHFFQLPPAPHLVLLDTGMVATLTPSDQRNLVQFFKAITSKDGQALAHNILAFSEGQTCPDPAGFTSELKSLFDGLDLEKIKDHTSEVIGDIMDTIRRHQVALKGVVSTVVVTTLVLEGWSTKLNPDIRIMETMKEMLPMDWRERMSRTVDKLVAADVEV